MVEDRGGRLGGASVWEMTALSTDDSGAEGSKVELVNVRQGGFRFPGWNWRERRCARSVLTAALGTSCFEIGIKGREMLARSHQAFCS